MKKHDELKEFYLKDTNSIIYIHILIGLAGLFLGSLIYLSDRPPESTWFVRQFFYGIAQKIHGIFPDMFGAMGGSLASFLHTFSFTMITGAFIAESRKSCFMAALFWCVINVLFEAGQYFDAIAIKLVPEWFEQYAFLKTVDDYFIAGFFDFWDIAAIFAGALIGYLMLMFTNE
ncbi:MAG: hypothetical protein HQK67_02155 [Desulfamplus sp.]|nr:hypothetical protein [Desulfamplus sp.]